MKRLNAFNQRSGTRQGGPPLSPPLFIIVLEALTNAIRQEKLKANRLLKEEIKSYAYLQICPSKQKNLRT